MAPLCSCQARVVTAASANRSVKQLKLSQNVGTRVRRVGQVTAKGSSDPKYGRPVCYEGNRADWDGKRTMHSRRFACMKNGIVEQVEQIESDLFGLIESFNKPSPTGNAHTEKEYDAMSSETSRASLRKSSLRTTDMFVDFQLQPFPAAELTAAKQHSVPRDLSANVEAALRVACDHWGDAQIPITLRQQPGDTRSQIAMFELAPEIQAFDGTLGAVAQIYGHTMQLMGGKASIASSISEGYEKETVKSAAAGEHSDTTKLAETGSPSERGVERADLQTSVEGASARPDAVICHQDLLQYGMTIENKLVNTIQDRVVIINIETETMVVAQSEQLPYGVKEGDKMIKSVPDGLQVTDQKGNVTTIGNESLMWVPLRHMYALDALRETLPADQRKVQELCRHMEDGLKRMQTAIDSFHETLEELNIKRSDLFDAVKEGTELSGDMKKAAVALCAVHDCMPQSWQAWWQAISLQLPVAVLRDGTCYWFFVLKPVWKKGSGSGILQKGGVEDGIRDRRQGKVEKIVIKYACTHTDSEELPPMRMMAYLMSKRSHDEPMPTVKSLRNGQHDVPVVNVAALRKARGDERGRKRQQPNNTSSKAVGMLTSQAAEQSINDSSWTSASASAATLALPAVETIVHRSTLAWSFVSIEKALIGQKLGSGIHGDVFEYGDNQVIKIASARSASLQQVEGRWPYGSLQHEAHMYRICDSLTFGFYKVLPVFYGEGALDGKPCILLERLQPVYSGMYQRIDPELVTHEAVHQLHKLGVVHGDLRFQNLMVTASGTGVVVDLARAVDLDEWEEWENSDAVALGPPWYSTASWWGDQSMATARDMEARENENLDRLCTKVY